MDKIAMLTQILEQNPADAFARYGLAMEHVNQGQTEPALAEFDRLLSTHPDYTDYFETMPSNKLSLALWLESDRMRSLSITAENLKNQQDAVKEEKRRRIGTDVIHRAALDGLSALLIHGQAVQNSSSVRPGPRSAACTKPRSTCRRKPAVT